jgi:hypothetical protein
MGGVLSQYCAADGVLGVSICQLKRKISDVQNARADRAGTRLAHNSYLCAILRRRCTGQRRRSIVECSCVCGFWPDFTRCKVCGCYSRSSASK